MHPLMHAVIINGVAFYTIGGRFEDSGSYASRLTEGGHGTGPPPDPAPLQLSPTTEQAEWGTPTRPARCQTAACLGKVEVRPVRI